MAFISIASMLSVMQFARSLHASSEAQDVNWSAVTAWMEVPIALPPKGHFGDLSGA